MTKDAEQLKEILKELNARIVVEGIAYCVESIVQVEGRTLLFPGKQSGRTRRKPCSSGGKSE